jgi:hypothetical protein
MFGMEVGQLTNLTFSASDWVLEDANGARLTAEQHPLTLIMNHHHTLLDQHYVIHAPGGVSGDFVLHGSPILDNQGQPVGAIFAVEKTAHE